MDAVQFGQWIGERRSKYGFRSQRALAERVSNDPTLGKSGITENFLARLEAGSFAYPFRGNVRSRVMSLAWLLCTANRDVNAYYQAAGFSELDDSEAEQLRVLRRHLARRQSQRVLPLPLRPQRLIGREPVVREIIDSLCAMETGLYAITGLPGVGKSALASEVAHRLAAREQAHMRAFPDGIAAFTCTGRHGISGLLSLLADIIAFFGSPAPSRATSYANGRSRAFAASSTETELASMLDRVRLALADKHALLLLDDVEAQLPLRQVKEALLAQDQQALLRQNGNHTGYARRAILTTGCFIPPPALVTHHLHLESLEPDAALVLFTTLIKRSLSLEEVQAAKQVCAAVGYLPLAIEVAATAVAVKGIPLPFLAVHVAERPLDDVLDGGYELRSRLDRALGTFDARARKRFALLSTLGVAAFDSESVATVLSKGTAAKEDEHGDTSSKRQDEPVSEGVANAHSHDESSAVDGMNLPPCDIARAIAALGQFVQHSLINLASSDEPVSTHPLESAPVGPGTRYHLHPLISAYAEDILNQGGDSPCDGAT